LRSESLDMVCVCTTPWAHAPNTISALNAGCHVFVEKPMALSVAECDMILEAASRNGRTVSVSNNFKFARSTCRANDLIISGELGDVLHVFALQLSSPKRRLPEWYPKLPGGLFYDEVPHMLYLLRHFAGNLRVDSATGDLAAPPAEQPLLKANVLFSGERASGHLKMLFDAPVSEWQVSVIGSKKIAIIDVFRDILVVVDCDHGHKALDIMKTSINTVWQHLWGFAKSGSRLLTGSLLYGHDHAISGFITSIITGNTPPISAEEGRDVVKMAHEIPEKIGCQAPNDLDIGNS
jgi:scyllo-inositol 2-dehydrogenase (NADP+)